MQNRISSFSPIIDKNSYILILGSVPGVKSLEKKEYYAHPQNAFWKIIFKILNEENTQDYQQKIEILQHHKIALWDVIESCERKGSSDAEIKNENHNKIQELLEEYKNIQAIFCNGQKSFKTLSNNKNFNLKIPIISLPSTSPMHTISFDEKFQKWEKYILPYLD